MVWAQTRRRAHAGARSALRGGEIAMAQVVLTVLGRDRPGLTRALADMVLEVDGNWLEGRLARLGGRFVGAVLVEVADERRAALEMSLSRLASDELEVRCAPAGADDHPPGEEMTFTIVGQDRPGIVRQVTQALSALRVNIEELTTGFQIGPHSGERLFTTEARLRLPPGVNQTQVEAALEDISSEIMVDLKLGR